MAEAVTSKTVHQVMETPNGYVFSCPSRVYYGDRGHARQGARDLLGLPELVGVLVTGMTMRCARFLGTAVYYIARGFWAGLDWMMYG